jgi:hypothetical protein
VPGPRASGSISRGESVDHDRAGRGDATVDDRSTDRPPYGKHASLHAVIGKVMP